MPQYVVHKIGFFYTDECFAVGEEKGTVMGITRSLEEALVIKNQEDIASLKQTAGITLENFYFDHPKQEEIIKQLKAYFESEFNTRYNGLYPGSPTPSNLTDEQAARLLEILKLSFHNIVLYDDNEVIDPATFQLDEEGDICGF
jgi:hypothetical protein